MGSVEMSHGRSVDLGDVGYVWLVIELDVALAVDVENAVVVVDLVLEQGCQLVLRVVEPTSVERGGTSL